MTQSSREIQTLPARLCEVAERALAGQMLDIVRTDSRLDLGTWWLASRVWLVMGEERLLILAQGRRLHRVTLERSDLQESLYNHVTSSLILAPAEAASIEQSLRMSYGTAQRVLEWIAGNHRARVETEQIEAKAQS